MLAMVGLVMGQEAAGPREGRRLDSLLLAGYTQQQDRSGYTGVYDKNGKILLNATDLQNFCVDVSTFSPVRFRKIDKERYCSKLYFNRLWVRLQL